MFSSKPFQGVYGDRVVEFITVANAFARVVTDPSANLGKGVFLLQNSPGGHRISLPNLPDKILDVVTGRAPLVTGRDFVQVPGFDVPPSACFIPEHAPLRDHFLRQLAYGVIYDWFLFGHVFLSFRWQWP
jgi:hypothetical protein